MTAALALLLLSVAPPSMTGIDQIKGTTKDGRYLVWQGTAFGGSQTEDLPATVVQDLLTGDCTLYGEDQERGWAPAVEYNKWERTHPLTPLKPGRESPDKKRVADVVAHPSDGRWLDDRFEIGNGLRWSLVVGHGGTTDEVGTCGNGETVDVWWTADGKHTVWLIERKGKFVRDPGYTQLVVGTDGTPAVQVLATRSDRNAAVGVAEQLAKGGFAVSSVGVTAKAREKSVVYAGKENQELAKKVAATVPGGASIDELTWRSDFDVVVALAPVALK